MNTYLKIDSAWKTPLSLHSSWLWLIPFAIASLVHFEIEPVLEATVTVFLFLGSVLLAALAQTWMAQRLNLKWHYVIVFPLGNIVTRTYRSNPRHEAQIALTALAVHGLLATVFGMLWFALPTGSLGIEMEIIALANAALFLFSALLRLSPNHDNLLHATVATIAKEPWPSIVMTFVHTVAIVTFAISGLFIIMLRVSWVGLGGWFAVAIILSQLATIAELHGDYRTNLELSPELLANTTSIETSKVKKHVRL